MLLVHITYVQDTVVIPVFIVRLYFDEWAITSPLIFTKYFVLKLICKIMHLAAKLDSLLCFRHGFMFIEEISY